VTDLEPAPPPDSRAALTSGDLILLVGACLILFSAALGWAAHFTGQDLPLRPGSLIAAGVVGIRTVARFPTLGQVVVILGLLAAVPAVLGRRSFGWNVVRWAAGIVMLFVMIRFPMMYADLFQDGPPDGTLGALRLGFYVAAVGTILVIVAPRRTEPAGGPFPWWPAVAFLGLAGLAFATQMTWVDQGFLPEGIDDPGIVGGEIPLPPLISRSAEGTVPTVGQALIGLAIGGLILMATGPERLSFDLIRRGLGVLALLLLALFAFRVSQLAGASGRFEYTMIGLLRIGFLKAVAGAIITVAVGHIRRSPAPQPPIEPAPIPAV
jgi:hypothetical protein